jgi:RNA polymerase sigma-70 factor, ECF subfamily
MGAGASRDGGEELARRLLLNAAESAARAWPHIALAVPIFVAHLRDRVVATEDPEAALAKVHVNDLFLACACLHGDHGAWRELDRLHLARIPDFVARIDRSPAFADEVRQRLAERLLRAEDGSAGKLALYTGRGPLGAWIRVAAVREAQNAKRGGRHAVDADDVVLESPDQDPEIQLLKRRYAKEFKDALEEVLQTLSADERNVLKLHYLDGLTIEEVGKAYRVSRATAARWIADARDTIVARTQKTLGTRLGKSGPKMESLLAFVRSQLDMSLRRHF